MAYGIFSTIVAMGALQALIMAVLLWRQPGRNASKRLLCAVLVVLALLSVKMLLFTLRWWWDVPLPDYLPLAIDTLPGPVLYVYSCSLTRRNFSLTRRYFPHFVVPVLFMMHALIVYGCSFALDDRTMNKIEVLMAYHALNKAEDILALVSAILYWGLCFTAVTRYRRWLFAGESATRYQELLWMRNLLIGFAVLVLLLGVSTLGVKSVDLRDDFYFLVAFYGYLALLIYFLSFKGYAMSLSGVWATPAPATPQPVLLPEPEEVVLPTAEGEEPSPLVRDALLTLMQDDKPYLEPELNLAGLAKKMNVPAAQVSAAINHYFGQNFRNWVNSYRVEEVKKRLADPANAHLNMTGIAFDCGFNSEASFYRLFRQFTGQSPKYYLQSLQHKG